ncbi:large-conductance mechanosensitive channel [Blastocladiella britannica]|nr:large-conductance mechanosensitive channel [Blastocladiella britannica]
MSHQLQEFGSGAMKGGKKAGKAAKGVWSDFQAFINKGNVVDLAVGLVIGTAFTLVVTSLVNDLITPVISLAGSGNSFAELFVVIRKSKSGADRYKTRAEAAGDGAITLNWGNFLQVIINFMIVAWCMFILIKAVRSMIKEKKKDDTKKCPLCCESVKKEAIRCKFCCAELAMPSSPSAAALQ